MEAASRMLALRKTYSLMNPSPEHNASSSSFPIVQRGDWDGVFDGQRTTAADVLLKATLQKSPDGGSGAFLGLANDGQRYWIKPLNNAQGERVPITEQIVGRVGSLLGVPTCEVRTISISEDFAGWEFRPGRALEPGIAHASLNVEDAIFTRALDRHMDDDNSRRYVFLFALYDWCWGGDVQGLLAAKDDNRFYSHDHGWYLPPEGPNWTINDLAAQADIPRELSTNLDGVGVSAAEEVASMLESMERDQLQSALSGIPSVWPASDDELEWVGFFLEKRAPLVAQRIKQRFRSPS
ncbi:MAG: hypothetical protein IH905_17260 [Proteobacteria bacterium]|nr:hypothetical protein [Pseudomonadota bacterium]